MKLIYTQSHHPAAEGRRRINPRFFTGVEKGATDVVMVGEWPKIVAAYEAIGVTVEQVDAPEPRAEPLAPPPSDAVVAEERDAVFIPDDWRDLPYNRPAEGRDLTMRGIAAMLSDKPVINKASAIEAIEAELERRQAAE